MASRDNDMNAGPRLIDEFPPQNAEAVVRSKLILAIADTMASRKLSQLRAAKLCRTDQPTLSKVLRGRTESVTINKLAGWLLALGRSVEVRVGRTDLSGRARLKVSVDRRSGRD